MASLQPQYHTDLAAIRSTLRTFKPDEVAELLGIGRTSVYKLMNEGQLSYILIAGKRRIPHDDLESFIRSCDRESMAPSEVAVTAPGEAVEDTPSEVVTDAQRGRAQRGRSVPEAPLSRTIASGEATVATPNEITVTVSEPSQTVAESLRGWLVWVRPRISPRTYESYFHIVEHYLIPAFGHYQLRDLPVKVIDQVLSDLMVARDDRQALAPSYVKKIHAVLRAAQNDAVRWGELDRNAAALVKPPKVRRRQKEALTDQEIRRMIAVSADDWYGPIVEFLAKTGTRRGEALGARWVDLDLDKCLLHVTGSLQREQRQERAEGVSKSVLQRGTPKTECSERTIVMPLSLVPLLRRIKEQQKILFVALQKPWSEQEYVFTTTVGTRVEPRNFNRYFDGLVRRATLPEGTTPHSLRHANITAMITGQVDPRTAQVRAGHSDVRVTLDVYAHSNLELQRSAAAAIDAQFAPPETPASNG